VDVIPFPSWRVFYIVDARGNNVIRRWMDEQSASPADRVAFQALIDICEYSGPDALLANTKDLGNGFYALWSKRKGGINPSPVFCRGPFSESEITFLAGARMEGKKLTPRYARGIAEENLEVLLSQPKRRTRESIA